MEKPSENLIETQRNLEELFNRNQLMDVLRAQFAPVLPEDDQDLFKISVLSQIYLHKQADVPTMVGLFSPKWGTPQEVAQLLMECVEENLMDFDMDTKKFVFIYGLSKDVEDQLDRYQFPLPMVVRPLKVTNNTMGSGYYDTKGRIILNGSEVFDEEDLCLDHINRANAVALTLNTNVVASDEGHIIVPKRKVGEGFEEYTKRRKQAQVFYDTSLEVMQGMLALGNEFYLTHKYDRRGRTYCVGYHINSQGTDYNKAVLELANKEIVTS